MQGSVSNGPCIGSGANLSSLSERSKGRYEIEGGWMPPMVIRVCKDGYLSMQTRSGKESWWPIHIVPSRPRDTCMSLTTGQEQTDKEHFMNRSENGSKTAKKKPDSSFTVSPLVFAADQGWQENAFWQIWWKFGRRNLGGAEYFSLGSSDPWIG